MNASHSQTSAPAAAPPRARPAAGVLAPGAWTIPLLALLTALPIALTRTQPLVDLPAHLGRMAVQVDGGASPVLARWYSVHWSLIPNLGTDLVVQALAPLAGVEAALRLAVIAIVACHAAGVLLVSRAAHGRVTPLAVFALPLAYGYPFQYGFLNFTFSVGLMLLALALWLGLTARRRFGLRTIVLVPLGFALWLAHLVGFTAFCIAAGACELARIRAARGLLAAAIRAPVALAPAAVVPLVLMALTRSGAGRSAGFDYAGYADKLRYLAMVLRDRWQVWDLEGAILLAAVAAWAWRSRQFARHSGLALAAMLLAAAYLAMPGTIMGSHLADMRLVPLVFTLFLLAPAPREPQGRTARTLTVAALSFAALRLFGNAVAFAGEDAEAQRTLAVLDAVPAGTNLVTFSVARCAEEGAWALPRRGHFGGYALARRHAFDNGQWQMPGGQVLAIHNPAAGRFEHLPGPPVYDRRCHGELGLADALAMEPAQVPLAWVIDAGDAPLPGWTVVRRSGSSAILHRDPAARPR